MLNTLNDQIENSSIEQKTLGFIIFFLCFFVFCREPMKSQIQVAMISEMIHSASLIHDDVIDQSNFRRGKPSVNVLWNHRKVSNLPVAN